MDERGGGRLTWSFIRFRRAPVPTLMILLANSTPIVCDERTRHSFLMKRCKRQDLRGGLVSGRLVNRLRAGLNSLSCPAWSEQNDLCQVIVHRP